MNWNNNLFDGMAINLDPNLCSFGNPTIYFDVSFQACNNLFRNCDWLRLEPVEASMGNWVFKDNLFDRVEFMQETNLPLDYNYNGYWPKQPWELMWGNSTQLMPSAGGNVSGAHDVVLSSAPPYQSGPFGNYYLPDTTPLYGTGSDTAADLGLYHFTTQPDQVKEGDEPAGHKVNIGLHYIAVTNPLTFTTFNSTFCDLLVIDATVNNGASSYSIDVYDSASSVWLTNLSGTVSDGKIETSWNLTDGNGNIISTGPVTCEFSLFNSLANANARNSAQANDSGSTSATKMYPKFLRNPYNATFTVAWGNDELAGEAAEQFGWGMCSVVDILNQYWEDPKNPALVYWIVPYGASGNANNPGGNISFNFGVDYPNSMNQLLQALVDSGNFFWAGHGSQTSISTGRGSPKKLKASDIVDALGNPVTAPNGWQFYNKPYKLVILWACSAYSRNFADAFGIAEYTPPRSVIHSQFYGDPSEYLDGGRSKSNVITYLNGGKIPQAFVAWPCFTYGAGNPVLGGKADAAIKECQAMTELFMNWETDDPSSIYSIYNCMTWFGVRMIVDTFNKDDEGNGIPNNEKWELSGCYDLRVTDRLK
jgi:hypothetical protein